MPKQEIGNTYQRQIPTSPIYLINCQNSYYILIVIIFDEVNEKQYSEIMWNNIFHNAEFITWVAWIITFYSYFSNVLEISSVFIIISSRLRILNLKLPTRFPRNGQSSYHILSWSFFMDIFKVFIFGQYKWKASFCI